MVRGFYLWPVRWIGWCAGWALLSAQTPVLIENADELGGTSERRLLQGHVRLRQDTVVLTCDRAALTADGAFQAEGHTQTQVGTRGIVWASRLFYDPALHQLVYEGGVQAHFPPTTLRAPKLVYDRERALLYYEGGGELRDTTGVIHSPRGYYYTGEEKATFGGGVRLLRGSYRVYSDSVLYDTRTYTAHFPRPVWAADSATHDSLYGCRALWYRLSGELFLSDSCCFWDSVRVVQAEAGYYHAGRDSGWAFCRVQYQQQGTIWAWADSASWVRDSLALLTNAALLWHQPDEIPVFLQAERLSGYQTRLVAWGQAELLQLPLRARADTLIYDTLQHRAWLSGQVWLGDTSLQVWAKALEVRLRRGRLDSAWASGSVGLLSKADTFLWFFHQVRGDSAVARWDTLGRLASMRLWGDVQAVYYQREEARWQGGHYLQAEELYAEMDSLQRPLYLRFARQPKGTFWPATKLVRNPLWIRGLRWLQESERPQWPFVQRLE